MPKSPTAQAIGYARNQWEALTRSTTNGLLSIDNNAAERGLRATAVGRKNWLFFQEDGSLSAAEPEPTRREGCRWGGSAASRES